MSTQEERDAQEVVRLRKSERGLTTNFNNKLQQAQLVADSLANTTNLSTFSLEKLLKSSRNLDEAKEKLEDCYLKVAELVGDDDDTRKTFEGRLEKLNGDYDAQASRLRNIMDQSTPQANQLPGAAAAAQPQQRNPRIDDSLKPKVLSLEDTPGQYRDWRAGFEAWYNYNQMNNLELAIQLNLLFTVIDMQLKAHLETHKTVTTPIFPSPTNAVSCTTIIDDEFERTYPIAQKRVRYFRAKHDRGESFTSFLTKLRRLGIEADIQAMGPEETNAFVAIVACNDEKLRNRLLELPTVDMASIEKEARNYEQRYNITHEIDKPKAITAAVNAKRRCDSCNSRNHDGPCPIKHRLRCLNCNRKGHVEEVCNYRERDRPTWKNGERQRTRNGSRDRSPDQERHVTNHKNRNSTRPRNQSPVNRRRSPYRKSRARAVSPRNPDTDHESTSNQATEHDSESDQEEQDF